MAEKRNEGMKDRVVTESEKRAYENAQRAPTDQESTESEIRIEQEREQRAGEELRKNTSRQKGT